MQHQFETRCYTHVNGKAIVRGSYRKSWATIFSKVTWFIIDKPKTPPLSTDLIFHAIATLYTFLRAFWEFENSPSLKFRSSRPKTLTHCFRNCLPCLITSTQLILHNSEKMVVGGCQIRVIGGCGRTSHPIFAIASDVWRAVWGRALWCRMKLFRPGSLSRNVRRSFCSVWT